jgi:Arc/MetJ-type ribon-helix-helix transcriptional regulator
MPVELTREAEVKLRTLVESFDFPNESAVVNELFYQFVLNQDSERRRMIMAIYQLNVKETDKILR